MRAWRTPSWGGRSGEPRELAGGRGGVGAARDRREQAGEQKRGETLFEQARFIDASIANVEAALRYLDALPAGGGTNQLEGIRRALELPKDDRRLRMVLLMTDGFIGNEAEILAEVQARYRELVAKYHPDKHAKDPEKHRAATELVAQLSKSYQTLLEKLSV